MILHLKNHLKSNLNIHQQQIVALKTELADAQTQLKTENAQLSDQLTQQGTHYARMIDALRAELDDKQTLLDAQNVQLIDALKTDLADKQSQLDTLLVIIQELESDQKSGQSSKQQLIDTLKTEMATIKTQLDTRIAQVTDAMETELGDKQTQLDILLHLSKDHRIELDIQKSQTVDQQKLLDAQNAHLSDVINRINESQVAMMEFYSSNNEHIYYVSRPIHNNIAVADSVCRMHGGYLLETDDVKEFEFVVEMAKGKGIDELVIGGRDDVKEGKWVYLRSGKPVNYFNWNKGEPNNAGDEDCTRMLNSKELSSWRMNDDRCLDTETVFRFICEIES